MPTAIMPSPPDPASMAEQHDNPLRDPTSPRAKIAAEGSE